MRLVRLERQQSRVADDVRAALASLGRGSTVIGGIALVGVGSVTERPIEAVVLLPHGVIIVIGVDLPDPALRLEAPLGAEWKADGWPLVADDDAVNPATEALDISQACERRIAALVPGTAPVGTIIAVGPYVETVDQPAGDLAGPVRVLHPTPTTMLAATVSLATAHRPRSVDQVRALIRGLAPSAPEFPDEVLIGEGFSRLTDDSPPESLWDSPPPAQPAPAGPAASSAEAASAGSGGVVAASDTTGAAANPASTESSATAAASTATGPAATPASADSGATAAASDTTGAAANPASTESSGTAAASTATSPVNDPPSADSSATAAASDTTGPAAAPASAESSETAAASAGPAAPDSAPATSAAAASTATDPTRKFATAATSAAPSSAAANETGWRTETPVPAEPDTAATPAPGAEPAVPTTPAADSASSATATSAAAESAAACETEPPAEPPTAAAPPEPAAEPEPDLPSAAEEALADSARTEVLPAQGEPRRPAETPARPVFPGAEIPPPLFPGTARPADEDTERTGTLGSPAEPPLPFPKPRPQPEPAAATSRTVRWLPLGAIGLLVVLVVAAIAVATTGDGTAAAPPPSSATPPPTSSSSATPVKSLQFGLRAAGGDQRCASHAFGDAQASLQQTSCSGVRRASYAATVDGHAAAVTIGIVEFPDAGHAAAFKAVADTPGGGGILDLAAETGKWGTATPRFENAAYASKLEGTSVRLVQAVWAPGPSTPDDPGLVRAAKAALDLPAQ